MNRDFWFGRTTYADILTRRRYERSYHGWKEAFADLIEATMPLRVHLDLYRDLARLRRERARHDSPHRAAKARESG